MNDVCVIPCGNKKIWSKQPLLQTVQAKQAYIGTFHRLCRAYAHLFFDKYLILSAKHGFLWPDDEVDGPYNVSFTMKNNQVIQIDQLKIQINEKKLSKYDRFVVLTGKKYLPILESVIGDKELEFPLLKCKGIGYMQRDLKRSVENKVPIHRIKGRSNNT